MMSADCPRMFVSRLFTLLLLSGWLVDSAWAVPKITNFSPRSGAPGATITLTGSGLGTVNAVNFNGAQATILAASASVLRVIVPPNALNGAIFVRDTQGFTYDTGAALLPDFLATPRITSVKRVSPPADSPAEEVRIAPGNIVEVIGANYLSFTDPGFAQAVRVDFTGPNGNLRVVPNTIGTTVLQVTVPNGGVSGRVTVITPVGTVTSVGDLFYQPIVTRFTLVAAAGKDIEIAGTSLKGASQVIFGDIPVTPSSVSNTNIIVRVPAIIAPVRLTVVTPGGAFLTGGNFSLAPTINGFTPPGGPTATPVTITGSGLAGATKVRFGTKDAPVVSATPGEVKTLVPIGATTGPLTVITPLGTNTTSSNFFLPPIVSSVTPNRAKAGANVTVTGTSLTGATEVRVAGTLAEHTVLSDTNLTVKVPEGAVSGLLQVINPGGTNGLPFTVLGREPIIESFTPESGLAGTVVKLVGLNFIGTTAVEFSNAPASTFNVASDTNLTVTVPAGARSGPITVRNAFGTGRTTRNFVIGTNTSLSLEFSANPISVLPGETLVLNLEVKNGGPLPSAGTQVRLLLPDGLDYVDSTLFSGTISLLLDGLVWDVGTVGVNQSVLGFLRMAPRFVGAFPVTATASTTTPDPVKTDNKRELTVSAGAPGLNFRGREGNNLILGWPIEAVDYALQSTPSLEPALWTPVTLQPVEFQDELRVQVPLTGGERWYRLAPR